MEDIAKLVALTLPQFAAVVALFLPGFVSIKIDRLAHPGKPATTADFVVDAFAYSLINAAVFGWAILLAGAELKAPSPNYPLVWALGVLVCFLGPGVWPFVFRAAQRFGARRRWLLDPERTAWDHYFRRGETCWVIVHLKGGRQVGGYFGFESYATVEPQSGQIYVEQLWQLSRDGRFVRRIPNTKGALFRPEDYIWLEFVEDRGDGQT